MKKTHAIFLILLVATISACRIYSIVDLANPEFPLELNPSDLSEKVLEKYTVGNVIVEPQIRHGVHHGQYKLTVLYSSESTAVSASIDKVSVLVNSKEISYGDELLGKRCLEWQLYSENEPRYVCSISGATIDPPELDMTKVRVDVSLMVSVQDENGHTTEKQIDVYFVPKKRSYLE